MSSLKYFQGGSGEQSPEPLDVPAELVVIDLNGERQAIPASSSVETLLARLGLEAPRVAVAINRAVVPRSAYPTHALHEGDRVEILEAVGGG